MGSPEAIDADTLHAMLRAGGIEVTKERAAAILPVARALLAGCDRLAALDLASPGGSGMVRAPEERP